MAGERRLQIVFCCTCLLCADLGVSAFYWHYNVIHQEQEHLMLASNPKDYLSEKLQTHDAVGAFLLMIFCTHSGVYFFISGVMIANTRVPF